METGTALPEVTATLADGSALPLPSLAGAPAVVYFYPKADTPGCTKEAEQFTALADDFAAAGVTVVGISKDAPAALAKFAAKRSLTVRLASDETGAICDAFGIWGEKSMYGKTYMGIERPAGARMAQGEGAGARGGGTGGGEGVVTARSAGSVPADCSW